MGNKSATVQLGFMAPKIREQFPQIDESAAYNYDQDNLTIHRLKIRGLITPNEAKRACDRLIKHVSADVKRVNQTTNQPEKEAPPDS